MHAWIKEKLKEKQAVDIDVLIEPHLFIQGEDKSGFGEETARYWNRFRSILVPGAPYSTRYAASPEPGSTALPFPLPEPFC